MVDFPSWRSLFSKLNLGSADGKHASRKYFPIREPLTVTRRMRDKACGRAKNKKQKTKKKETALPYRMVEYIFTNGDVLKWVLLMMTNKHKQLVPVIKRVHELKEG